MTTYSNPRTDFVVNDWPTGSYKTVAHFWIEANPKLGERAVRTTAHPITGKIAAPKKLPYAVRARIVDGDDGRTYIAELSIYGGVSIMRGDMKFQHEYIGQDDPRAEHVRGLFA